MVEICVFVSLAFCFGSLVGCVLRGYLFTRIRVLKGFFSRGV